MPATEPTTHLYWGFNKPHLVRDFPSLKTGYSACGQRLPRAQLTQWQDDNECKACTTAAASGDQP